jgi:hypothetical protein
MMMLLEITPAPDNVPLARVMDVPVKLPVAVNPPQVTPFVANVAVDVVPVNVPVRAIGFVSVRVSDADIVMLFQLMLEAGVFRVVLVAIVSVLPVVFIIPEPEYVIPPVFAATEPLIVKLPPPIRIGFWTTEVPDQVPLFRTSVAAVAEVARFPITVSPPLHTNLSAVVYFHMVLVVPVVTNPVLIQSLPPASVQVTLPVVVNFPGQVKPPEVRDWLVVERVRVGKAVPVGVAARVTPTP